MENYCKSTNYWTHPIKKTKVTDSSSNEKRAYKTDGIIFSK